MTLEEAKKLKPGDWILAKFKVNDLDGEVVTDNGYVRVIDDFGDNYVYVKLENIQEKIEPPRRKYRKDDIVKLDGEDQLYTVRYDENGSCLEIETSKEKYKVVYREAFSLLSLVCAAENRADKKGGEA